MPNTEFFVFVHIGTLIFTISSFRTMLNVKILIFDFYDIGKFSLYFT